MNQHNHTWARSTLLGIATAALCALIAPEAHAESRIPDNSWRHNDDKVDSTKAPRRPMFAAEIRFAPYWPNVDSEFNTDKGPYYKVFGSKPNFYFGLEFDFMPLRIPYVGMIGPGFGWGFTQSSALANLKGTQKPSSERTHLTIMPMHLSAVLRADELMHRTGVPIVPYGKFGLGLATWSASTASGTAVVGTTNGSPCTSANADNVGCVKGQGETWGLHFAIGGMFSLNWLDPRSAGLLYEDTDIAHIYLFGEWMDDMLNGLSSKKELHVGTSTGVAGIAGDF